MSIAVICKNCGKVLSAPDAAAGKKVKCSQCGGISPVGSKQPVAQSGAKICADCGVDVAGQKRTKDNAGRYFCQPCWNVRVAAAQTSAPTAKTRATPVAGAKKPPVNPPTESLSNPFAEPQEVRTNSEAMTCPACGRDVSRDDMTVDELGEPLCWPCQNERTSPLELTLAEPAAMPAAVSRPAAVGSSPVPVSRNPFAGAMSDTPLLLKKIGAMVLSLALLAYFALWPMYQVTQRVPKISISFKLMFLGAMLFPLSVASLAFGDKAHRWGTKRRDPLTPLQIAVIVIAIVIGGALTGFVYYFFDSNGYTIKW